jgi:hypothetical protein
MLPISSAKAQIQRRSIGGLGCYRSVPPSLKAPKEKDGGSRRLPTFRHCPLSLADERRKPPSFPPGALQADDGFLEVTVCAREEAMKLTEADVIWTPSNAEAPNCGAVRVERHKSGWQRTRGDLWMPAGALGECGQIDTKRSRERQLLAMFILFNTLVVRDGIDARRAHQAFLGIDEYRMAISPLINTGAWWGGGDDEKTQSDPKSSAGGARKSTYF